MTECFNQGHALLPGIGQGADPQPVLSFTAKDMQAAKQIILSQMLCAYPVINLQLLHEQGVISQQFLII